MLTRTAYGDSRLSLWLRVREFAVPPSMIETATVRRAAGDWAGACAAAGVDIDLDLRSVARAHGRELASRIRADLRHLAPDLLRWHMPRIAPDGLLRPGLTLTLARYDHPDRPSAPPLHLVVRTPPAWADAGQRIGLALWDGSARTGAAGHSHTHPRQHPHPRPSRRFRFDLHRHLWDARRAGELWARSGAERSGADGSGANRSVVGLREKVAGLSELGQQGLEQPELGQPNLGCAVDRWAAEAAVLLGSEGRRAGTFVVRLGGRRRLVLDLMAPGAGGAPAGLRIAASLPEGDVSALPVLPDAATWSLPDLELLRAGLLEPGQVHALVAAALVPGHPPSGAPRGREPAGSTRLVECRGARHRIGHVDGVLAPLDHTPQELRREELLVALGGPPLPCLRFIDEAHRRPDCLADVRERLNHGDTAGALAVVEGLLGPSALLRDGSLRDALEAAAEWRITYGLYRAGLVGPGHAPLDRHGRATVRHHRRRPRQATFPVPR
ncbi:hypothetical protein OIB37_03620 [Streptomyces sp. NBC_00820]|uniref:hypothetical protein n=1 Tax=Streptomyces sp. NBC_00820 TaxID=2975842 RepID=UPI002ED6C178|nr:hypothetical protein OIB37_03620 [Streptomyces sp. NBC_00820]